MRPFPLTLNFQGKTLTSDLHLGNNFLLSSKTFSPSLFLSEVHSNASTQSLLQGLDFLSRSIDQKSASLKVLVESNFERFVRVKATIDEVYNEMRTQGGGPGPGMSHSRNTSRSSAHFRNTSGSGTITGIDRSSSTNKRKNALTPETDYGVQGIKVPLVEASTRAIEVWGPALGGRDREDSLRAVLGVVERHRGIFTVASTIGDCISRKDYESLVEEYGKARRYADEARDTANGAIQSNAGFTDAQIHQVIITARMWVDVEERVDHFRRDLLRRLVDVPAVTSGVARQAAADETEEHLQLIGLLLELGTQENPIWVWLLSRYQHLRERISTACDRFRAETEFLRRHLASEARAPPEVVAHFLRASEMEESPQELSAKDTTNVVEMWERVLSSLDALLATRGSVLADVIEFWETTVSFIEGRAQRTLPVGFHAESRRHHRLSSERVKDLQRGVVELIGLIRDNVQGLFTDPPIDDLSILSSSGSGSLLGQSATRLNFHAKQTPPAATSHGEPWDSFAFWPPHANCLSGAHYLSKVLVLVGSAAGDMSAMSTIGKSNSTQERLRYLVSSARERSAQAICAAWKRDAEDCKALEDWKRSADRKDNTEMPTHFMAFESSILLGMQKILYISEAMSKSGSADMVAPPSAKMLQLVRSQFVASLYKAFSGMVENAERPVHIPQEDELMEDGRDVAQPVTSVAATNLTAQSVDAQDQRVRILLTLSTLQLIRSEVVPHLITQFETNFSVKLTDETKTIRDVLGQIDARLFQSYTAPIIEELTAIIRGGVLDPQWAPSKSRPSEVRPYIYQALLCLVMVHAQTSTTAPTLTPQILSYLLEQTSMAMLQAFRQRSKFSLAALMQATLDVEFVAQTLSQYTTDKASEVQSQIYLEIDQGTDNEARRMLQNELPQMRSILKVLRESSKAELCVIYILKPFVGRQIADRTCDAVLASSVPEHHVIGARAPNERKHERC